jgi:hypothetical protein
MTLTKRAATLATRASNAFRRAHRYKREMNLSD